MNVFACGIIYIVRSNFHLPGYVWLIFNNTEHYFTVYTAYVYHFMILIQQINVLVAYCFYVPKANKTFPDLCDLHHCQLFHSSRQYDLILRSLLALTCLLLGFHTLVNQTDY